LGTAHRPVGIQKLERKMMKIILSKKQWEKIGEKTGWIETYGKKQTEKTMSQKEALDFFLPVIEEKGKKYKKFQKVMARSAKEGEKITTETSDGKETENKAKKGDYVVKNQTGAKELYIISEKKLKERYKKTNKKDKEWTEYVPTGKIMAIQFDADKMHLSSSFYFMAEWKEKMVVKNGDYICTTLPKKNETYRIAKKEFSETYKLDEK
jgi:hypothetical protein